MSNSYLCEDLLVLVLKRLPPKSLGRSKCVSKSWEDVISSSEFIRFHLEYQSSIQTKPKTLLSNDVGGDDDSEKRHETYLAEYSINNNNEDDMELGCEIQKVYNPYEGHAPGTYVMLVGCCHGLLCHVLCGETTYRSIYGEYELSLCNPLTKTKWVLPESPFAYLNKQRRRRIAFYGFGYDDVHHTYKVFLACGPNHDEYQIRRNKQADARYEYQVYSLSSNQWIIVTPSADLEDLHDYVFECDDWYLDGILTNCALHWILRNDFGPLRNKDIYYILAFDLRVDQLNILPVPDDAKECNNLILTMLNGCLLLSNYAFDFANGCTFDMWVMKDYGIKDSWTRIRIHNMLNGVCYKYPVALFDQEHRQHRKRKVIYHNYWTPVLVSYDVDTYQVVEFPATSATFEGVKNVQFVGSLVQPHPPSFPPLDTTRLEKTIAEFGPSPRPWKKQRSQAEI